MQVYGILMIRLGFSVQGLGSGVMALHAHSVVALNAPLRKFHVLVNTCHESKHCVPGHCPSLLIDFLYEVGCSLRLLVTVARIC